MTNELYLAPTPHTCNCGRDKICEEQVYKSGYCWNPMARRKALDEKAARQFIPEVKTDDIRINIWD